MASIDFDYIQSIATNDDSAVITQKDVASVKKFDIIVIQERPAQVIEITRAPIGSRKYFFVGIDIFSGHRCEAAISGGQMVQVPHLNKKDYLIISIDDDNYVTLLDEDTCDTRSDLKFKKNSDLGRQLLDKYNEGNGQIKVTVVKALGEEQIMKFKIVD